MKDFPFAYIPPNPFGDNSLTTLKLVCCFCPLVISLFYDRARVSLAFVLTVEGPSLQNGDDLLLPCASFFAMLAVSNTVKAPMTTTRIQFLHWRSAKENTVYEPEQLENASSGDSSIDISFRIPQSTVPSSNDFDSAITVIDFVDSISPITI